VPSDDRNLEGTNIKHRAINAQDVLNKIVNHNPYVCVFLLDCCRNYHLRHQDLLRASASETTGLKPMHATAGSLIAFACAPGTSASDGTGRNGLFTKHLLLNITKPNEEVQDLLIDVTNGVAKESHRIQVPWQNGSLMHRNIFLSNNGGGELHFSFDLSR
jgi:uncharacterized caspase-like protein